MGDSSPLFYLFRRHFLWQDNDGPVAFDGSGQCQTDAGVPRGGFDDGVAGLEESGSLGVLYHPQPDAVLHTATSVEELALGHCKVKRKFFIRHAGRRKKGIFKILLT